jgi:hypothetical protein
MVVFQQAAACVAVLPHAASDLAEEDTKINAIGIWKVMRIVRLKADIQLCTAALWRGHNLSTKGGLTAAFEL